jgi:hypothetical protein
MRIVQLLSATSPSLGRRQMSERFMDLGEAMDWVSG